MESEKSKKLKSDIIWLGCILSRCDLMDEEKEAIKHTCAFIAETLKEEEKRAVCIDNCDKCEHGVPIDGQFYDDGTPICECGYKQGGK